MAAGLGDLIQVVDNQMYLEQQVLNVYYYRVTSITGLTDGYLEVLNSNWNEFMMPAITNIQVDDLLHVSREWRNLTNGTDLFVDTEVIPGDVPSSGSINTPSYVSLGFLLRRESLTTRNGYKRFAGLPDDAIDGNVWTGDVDDIHQLEDALAADITEGLATIAEPIIVKRPIVVPVEEYEYSSISSAQFRGLGTQNTRKAGRGV